MQLGVQVSFGRIKTYQQCLVTWCWAVGATTASSASDVVLKPAVDHLCMTQQWLLLPLQALFDCHLLFQTSVFGSQC